METPTVSFVEKTLIELMANGDAAVQIADKMKMQESTIEQYRYKLYKKLGVRNSSECVAFALRRGIIQ